MICCLKVGWLGGGGGVFVCLFVCVFLFLFFWLFCFFSACLFVACLFVKYLITSFGRFELRFSTKAKAIIRQIFFVCFVGWLIGWLVDGERETG